MRLAIEPAGESGSASCDCCGLPSRTVWGYVHRSEATLAAYFVSWAPGHAQEHGASFDIILGDWGDDTERGDRVGVSLAYRLVNSAPTFMVQDAGSRPFASSELFGAALSRAEVMAGDFRHGVFAICDEILSRDVRVQALVEGDVGTWPR